MNDLRKHLRLLVLIGLGSLIFSLLDYFVNGGVEGLFVLFFTFTVFVVVVIACKVKSKNEIKGLGNG